MPVVYMHKTLITMYQLLFEGSKNVQESISESTSY